MGRHYLEIVLLFYVAGLSHAAGPAENSGAKAPSRLATDLARFFDAIPRDRISNVLPVFDPSNVNFLADAIDIDKAGSEMSMEEYGTQRDDLVLKLLNPQRPLDSDVESSVPSHFTLLAGKMGLVAELLRERLSLKEFPEEEFLKLEAAYNDTRKNLFNGGLIDRVHISIRELGAMKEPIESSYEMLRKDGREWDALLYGADRTPLLPIFEQDIAPRAVAKPENFIFLVHGHEVLLPIMRSSLSAEKKKRRFSGDVTMAASTIAQNYNIPLKSHIVSSAHGITVRKYLEQKRHIIELPPELAYKALAMHLIGTGRTLYGTLMDLTITTGLTWSQAVGITLSNPREVLRPSESDQWGAESLAEDLADISNAISYQMLHWLLGQHPNRNSVFIFMPQYQLPTLSPMEIDSALRLSAREMETTQDENAVKGAQLALLSRIGFELEDLVIKASPTPDPLKYQNEAKRFEKARDHEKAASSRISQALHLIKVALNEGKSPSEIASQIEIKWALDKAVENYSKDARYAAEAKALHIFARDMGDFVVMVLFPYLPVAEMLGIEDLIGGSVRVH